MTLASQQSPGESPSDCLGSQLCVASLLPFADPALGVWGLRAHRGARIPHPPHDRSDHASVRGCWRMPGGLAALCVRVRWPSRIWPLLWRTVPSCLLDGKMGSDIFRPACRIARWARIYVACSRPGGMDLRDGPWRFKEQEQELDNIRVLDNIRLLDKPGD